MLKKVNEEWRKKYDNDPKNDGMSLKRGAARVGRVADRVIKSKKQIAIAGAAGFAGPGKQAKY